VRVVLDTNTIVSALLWGGIPDQLLAAATDARIEIFTSPALLDELGDVLARDKILRRQT
jgi:putative PIN family toxin of toxin-antitoxin system